jgi:hypothetical protein
MRHGCVCMVCQKVRRADQIEADGGCELCHMAGLDDPAVGTEFDLDTETAASWAWAVTAARPANGNNDVTAPMRAAGSHR